MAGNLKKYGKACMNLILVIVIVLGCIYLAPKIILLFMPFLIGGFLAWIVNPIVRFLEEKLKIRRKAGSAIVILSAIAGICFLIYYVGNRLLVEAADLLRILPDVWKDIKVEFIGYARKWSGLMENLPEEMVDGINQLGQNLGEESGVLIGRLTMPSADVMWNVPGTIITVIMCLLSAYFFVAEKEYVVGVWKKRIPKRWQEKCLLLKQITVDVLVEYVKAQIKIEFWVYLVIAAGLLFMKVRYGYLIAIPIALLDMLPIFGTGTVLIPWTICKLLWGEYMYALALLAIWGVSQLVRQIIQPKVIGDSMGISTIPSLILLYLGYRFAGIAGMIAAVPLGILVLTMNKAGFFDNSKKSIGILWQGFQELRQFTKEGLEEIRNDETQL